MKFLIYIPQLIFGGAEKVLVSFANDLVKRGHEVEVLELYEKGLLKPQFDTGVTFHAICSNEYTQKYYASLSQIKAEPYPEEKRVTKQNVIHCEISVDVQEGFRREHNENTQNHSLCMGRSAKATRIGTKVYCIVEKTFARL